MNSSKVLLGILGGVVAGTLLGVLLAPEKGSKTRKKILDKGDNLVVGIKDKMDSLQETMSQKKVKV